MERFRQGGGVLIADYEHEGHVRGRHYTAWVNRVKELRRSGDDIAAETLLNELIDATERESAAVEAAYMRAGQPTAWPPAPWYFEQMAIIYRKRRDYAAEIAILERYRGWAGDSAYSQRLEKARVLSARMDP